MENKIKDWTKMTHPGNCPSQSDQHHRVSTCNRKWQGRLILLMQASEGLKAMLQQLYLFFSFFFSKTGNLNGSTFYIRHFAQVSTLSPECIQLTSTLMHLSKNIRPTASAPCHSNIQALIVACAVTAIVIGLNENAAIAQPLLATAD